MRKAINTMEVIVCAKLMVLYKKYKPRHWLRELELFRRALPHHCRKQNVMSLKITLPTKSDRFLQRFFKHEKIRTDMITRALYAVKYGIPTPAPSSKVRLLWRSLVPVDAEVQYSA